jgi:hypothetical protein
MNTPSDWRNIKHGWEIPTITCSDQPYVVKTDDGAWLCCVTTGVGREAYDRALRISKAIANFRHEPCLCGA